MLISIHILSEVFIKLFLSSSAVCETFHHSREIEEDFANCTQVKHEVCRKIDGCPTVPKTECAIFKRNVTREYPETEAS
jgi:hypothetical protein